MKLTQLRLMSSKSLGPSIKRIKRADDGSPLHSFRTLLQDLGTMAYNVTSTSLNPNAKIVITTRPTPTQAKAFKLLNVNPVCSQ